MTSRPTRVQRVIVFRSLDSEVHIAVAAQSRPATDAERAIVSNALTMMVDSITYGIESQLGHQEVLMDEVNGSGFQQIEYQDAAVGVAVAHGFLACAAQHHDLTFNCQGAYTLTDDPPRATGFVACVFGEHAEAFKRSFDLFRQARTGLDPA